MSTASDFQPDVIVVGAGLAGLVATHELAKAGKRVLVLDQENRHNLGGQAFWSLGGLFFVDSPEQHRMGIHDSLDLALQDWHGSAQFDRFGDGTGGPGRGEDFWPAQWAEAYVRWANEGKRDYVRDLGLKSLTFVGWAERGDGRAEGHGNSVPRFHITWGTGPEVVRVFLEPVLEAEKAGLVQFGFRHQVDEVVVEDGAVVGVRGSVLAVDDSARGVKSSRDVTGSFGRRARAGGGCSGGIGPNYELMRRPRPPARDTRAAARVRQRVPAHVDGRMLAISEEAGATLVNKDRMWAYVEGVHNWDPIWPDHAIRILPGPSSMWFDANGKRLQGMSGVPGADSIGSMTQILSTGYDYSWFVLDQTIIEKEFALSGSEQNPDWTNKDVRLMLRDRVLGKGATGPVERFKKYGEDFVVASTIAELVEGMNAITRGPELSADDIERQIVARDRQVDNPFAKDAQIMAIHNGRKDRTGKIMRVAKPHKILDPEHGPLIAVRCNILSRKTLGGIETNLDSQAIAADGAVIPGLYAAGEVAGFGGGGVHGYNALEGTFLGGCIFSGRAAGLALARDL